MSSEQAELNTQIVRRYYDEVLARRNLATLDEIFAPDFMGHSAALGDFTLADVRSTIAREFEDMPADETIIEEQMVDGDRVMTRFRYRWRHDTSVFGEQPTGQWLAMEGVQIDRVVDGRIVERWVVKDFWGVITHLGGKATFPQSALES